MRLLIKLVINYSNPGFISHRFRDMASFPLKKTHIFATSSPFNPEFENVPLAVNGRNFARIAKLFV